MDYSLYIEPGEESLRKLDEKFVPVADDRFMYSLRQKKWSIEDIHHFMAQLQISFDYTNVEYERIKKLRETYNQKFPSDHKRYFSTAVELMAKMRSTLSTYKKIVEEFRPKRKRGRKYKKDAALYERTALFHGEYSPDMFGWDAYNDKSVKELYEKLNDYLRLAGDCLDECLAIIDEENAIRTNPDLACPLYRRSFDLSIRNNKQLIELLKNSNVNMDHDMVRAMEEAEDIRQLIASLFHEINTSDFNYFCACKKISDGRKVGLTKEESLLFGQENVEKVIRVRTLLDHISELAEGMDGVVGWKGMLSGCFVMHLLYWCGWNGSKNESLLNYITSRCKGKIGVVKMGAVMAEKRKAFCKDNAERMGEQQAFNQQIDAFVDSFLGGKARHTD